MDDKARHGFETARFQYAEVEEALAKAFGVNPDAQERAFRARLKHLQRLGLPKNRPGKGSRLDYSFEDAAKWAVTLMAAEIGVEPAAMVKVIGRDWRDIFVPIMKQAIDAESRAGNPVFLIIFPRVVSGAWGGEIGPKFIGHFRRYFYEGTDADGRPIRRDNVAWLLERDDGGWIAVRNLTAVLTKIEAVLTSTKD
jgi:hypothetical protein